jgi:hypothetical protein
LSYGATLGSKPSTRRKYSANVVAIAPTAAARMMASSAQPKRKAGSRPHAFRMKTKIPPVSGNAPATSANVSAPHIATMPPAIQTMNTAAGPGRRFVTLAGVRKIPEPIVMPMTTAMQLHSPSLRGSSPVVGVFILKW